MDHSRTQVEERFGQSSAATICEVFLAALIVLMLIAWVPLYVQWPRSGSHEHFASLAFGWIHGLLPYRDYMTINFPGEIYLYWLLGHVCGWSAEWSIYLFDLVCLAGALVFLVAWSRRVTGRLVAGLGILTFYLSYYTTQWYWMAAERDAQAALLALVCILFPMGWPSRWGAAWAGVFFAVGFIIRPHIVAFAPAAAISLAIEGPASLRVTNGWSPWRRWLDAIFAAMVTSLILWAPLVWAGLVPDFLTTMRLNLSGTFTDLSGYGRPSITTLLREVLWTKAYLGTAMLIAGAAVLVPWSRWRGLWLVVLTGQLGGLAYILIHPARHHYLEHPLMAMWALGLGLFLAEVCSAPIERRVGIALALVLALAFQYSHAKFMGSLRLSWRSIWGRAERIDAWRRQSEGPCLNVSWDDFANIRRWIAKNTGPDTRIANMASGINLATNLERLPALPIEGPWIWYHPDSEPPVRAALEANRDIVLIWNPHAYAREIGDFPELLQVIEAKYRPVAQFGVIELRRN